MQEDKKEKAMIQEEEKLVMPRKQSLKNQSLKCNKYLIPTLEEIMPELVNVKVFSTLDAKNGFWYIHLDKKFSKLTTFWIFHGIYRWIYIPNTSNSFWIE